MEECAARKFHDGVLELVPEPDGPRIADACALALAIATSKYTIVTLEDTFGFDGYEIPRDLFDSGR
jgi:hypothetical protein